MPAIRASYDFSKAHPNPYSRRLKKQVTIRLSLDTIAFFREVAEEVGIPYQTLIDLYLRDCAANRRKLAMRWRKSA